MNTNNRDFGTTTHKGIIYQVICDAWVDNKGTNGDVVYYAYATNNNKKYRVMWYTTPEWDKACELHNLECKLEDSYRSDDDIEEIKKEIQELEDEGVRSCYADDESNSCNWESADSVEEVE